MEIQNKFNDRQNTVTSCVKVGDVINMKKKHPCGSFEWEVMRIGADFRLKCKGCGHQIMIDRKAFEKNMM